MFPAFFIVSYLKRYNKRGYGMKNIYIKCVLAAALTCFLALTMLGAATDNETEEVKRLLYTRTDIMEAVLSGNITHEEGSVRLSEIEKGKLYSDDIKSLSEYRNSDYDKVKSMRIVSITKNTEIIDLISYEAQIEWRCVGYEGKYIESHSYSIGAEMVDNKLKLVSFDILQ